MTVNSFPCPHCSALLRLRDRRLIGRTVDCPDCGQAVVLEEKTGSGVIGGQRLHSVSTAAEQDRDDDRTDGAVRGKGARESAKWLAWAHSPLGVAWLVAGGLSAGFLGWVFTPTETPIRGRSDASIINPAGGSADDRRASVRDRNQQTLAEQVQDRFNGLFDRLAAHQGRSGSWPRGTAGDSALPRESRFSWLAVLASQSNSTGPQPHWNRAWDDPLNERFVRQRHDAFLNPAIDRQTGDDRYPASHFAGMTGYGADSDSLPAGHPRAGIFGSGRSTAPGDVPDGLANTMLLAGVNRHLGSWAAAGSSTLRGFTAEPYVNGPDGFGTGQADGMCVLMADGSVRFLSTVTDSNVIRRMAAKADGLPLDGSAPANAATVQQPQSPERPARKADENDHQRVESDSAVNPSPFDVANVVAELASGPDRPIDVPLVDDAEPADDQQPVDVEAALRQPIARFDQSTPVTARMLLRTLEEMAAVRIDTDHVSAAMPDLLDQPVSVTLHDTTVGDILRTVLGHLGLAYEPHGNHLRLLERGESD